jgi:HEAT repeats/Putative zinc-finger
MTCEETRKNLPLFLYGELSFDEEEQVEIHVDECAACRLALGREKALFQALDGAEMVPAPEVLEASRVELRRRLGALRSSSGMRAPGIWDKVREGFTVHFHFAPGIAQVAGAAAMLLLGFLTARVTPNSLLGNWHSAGVLAEPSTSRVRDVEAVAPGRVQIVVDETRQRVLSGRVDDQAIQRLLLTAAKDPSDAGLRVESVDLLKNNPQSAEIRTALVYALEHDSNAGVRLKALDGLKQFADDPDTRKALTRVLLTDDNPGVRTQVIDLLVQRHTDAMVGVLQELLEKEDNGYIRMRCQKVLQEMNASAETY